MGDVPNPASVDPDDLLVSSLDLVGQCADQFRLADASHAGQYNAAFGGEASDVADGDIPSKVTERFALTVEAILKEWHFPEADRVFFDSKSWDLMIAGKQRTARGKGLRAITHAAFTIGLLECCREQATPHPGFVVLDSPLLAYRAPDGIEDDLTGTDLNEQFYGYLAALPDNRQVIIVENSNPPAAIMARPQSYMFSRNPHSGRFGFFPQQRTVLA